MPRPTPLSPSRSDHPTDPSTRHLIAFQFASHEGAEEFAGDLAALHRFGRAEIHDVVFVTKDAEGVTHVIDEVAQMPAREGALKGGAWGVLVGILVGGPVAGLAVGAGLGALHARLPDRGVNREFVADIKQAVEPGKTVLIALVSHIDGEYVRGFLAEHEGLELLSSDLPSSAQQFLNDAVEPPAHPSRGLDR